MVFVRFDFFDLAVNAGAPQPQLLMQDTHQRLQALQLAATNTRQ